MRVDHYVYLSTQEAAALAAEQLRARGYTLSMREGADGCSWLLLIEQDVESLESREIEDVRAACQGISGTIDYDGWEAVLE